ncbi:MAG: hypothetical protein ACLVE7_06750 [Coprococcus comes]
MVDLRSVQGIVEKSLLSGSRALFLRKQIHAYEQKIWHFGYLYHPESQRMPEIFYGRYHRDICRDIFCWGGLCDRIQGISF